MGVRGWGWITHMERLATSNVQPAPRRDRMPRGFTLLEMLVVLTIVAALAAMAAPMLSDDSRLRVMAASSVLASDIELAQVMTISHPETPVVVRFDAEHAKYWLAYASDPETPLSREDTGQAYEITLGVGRARGADGVAFTIDGVSGETIAFGPHGGLTDFTLAPAIRLVYGDRGIQLAISADTGSIVETEFVPGSETESEIEAATP
jgi:prepilin-type N-terminal cleavage/methylation domain-containing protein